MARVGGLVLVFGILFLVTSSALEAKGVIDPISVLDPLRHMQVVPDVVDDFTASLTLRVEYSYGEGEDKVPLVVGGEEFAPQVLVRPPTLTCHGPGQDWNTRSYTLMMVNPDVPSAVHPQQRHHVHWLVVNMQGCNPNTGHTILEYEPVAPAWLTGRHRVVVLLFEQDGFIFPTPTIENNARDNFGVREFADCHHLGSPVGAAYLTVQNPPTLGAHGGAVVPDVVDDVDVASPVSLLVLYAGIPANRSHIDVLSAQKKPDVQCFGTANETYYTLMMLDPDAPSAKNHDYRCVRHWLVVNMPACAVDMGDELTVYQGPEPAPGSGTHRYIFLLFQQPHFLYIQEHYDARQRFRFDARAFADHYDLGIPVAAVMFTSDVSDVTVPPLTP